MELFTEKLRLVDIDFSFDIKSLVKDILGDPVVSYRKEGDIPFHRRYAVQEKAVTEGLQEGQVKHWISTVAIDTYGEVMLPKGAQLKYYKKNPMVLWAHNYTQPENIMGSNVEIEATDTGLMALTQFAMGEEKAARVYRLYKGKHLRMWSVGFIPIKGMKPKEPKKDAELAKLYEWVPNPELVQWIHQKWRLLEYSAVPVGANPDALTMAVKAAGGSDEMIVECQEFSDGLLDKIRGSKTIIDIGGLSKDDPKEKERKAEEADETETQAKKEFVYDPDEEGLEWDSSQGVDPEAFKKEYEEGEKIGDDDVTKPLPNEHACRLVDPAKFQKGSFRSYSRTAGNGKAYRVIAGRLKGKTTMTEQSFRYAKGTWSASEARKHCKDHKGILFEPAKAVDLDRYKDLGQFKDEHGDMRVSSQLWAEITTELEELREFEHSCKIISPQKSINEALEEIRAMRGELAEYREGAELSSKNRKIVQGAVEAMETAVERLTELLEATEKPKEVEEGVKEEGPDAIIELTGKQGEFYEKKEGEVVLTVIEKKEGMIDKLDFGKVFKKAFDQSKGEVK